MTIFCHSSFVIRHSSFVLPQKLVQSSTHPLARRCGMIERTTRIISENLARAIDRRTFLRRAGEVTFVGMAALAAGRAAPVFALGGGSGQPPQPGPLTPRCAPPGPYCNLNGVNEPNGCHGASCFQ